MGKLTKDEILDYRYNNVIRVFMYIAFIIVGMVLYTKNYLKISTIINVLGVMFIVTGAIFVFMCGKERKLKLSKPDVIFGFICALSGLLMILNPFGMDNNLYFYYSIFLVSCAGQKLLVALNLHKIKNPASTITLVTSIMIVALAVLLLINPFGTLTFSELCGLFAIFFGIIELGNTILLNNQDKDIIKKN